jgi:hypothetical protein
MNPMKKFILFVLVSVLMAICPLSFAQTDIGKLLDMKMDKAAGYLNKAQDTPKAWEIAVEISTIINHHPDYDDGEYAEGMNDLVTHLLMKPWKYAKPYLIGKKSTLLFQHFIIDHINELSTPHDLKIIKRNISSHCDQSTYPVCQKLIAQIDKSMT